MEKRQIRKTLFVAGFVAGGAVVGLLYYQFFGCNTGCAIASSPWKSMAYMGLVGGLLSGVFSPK